MQEKEISSIFLLFGVCCRYWSVGSSVAFSLSLTTATTCPENLCVVCLSLMWLHVWSCLTPKIVYNVFVTRRPISWKRFVFTTQTRTVDMYTRLDAFDHDQNLLSQWQICSLAHLRQFKLKYTHAVHSKKLSSVQMKTRSDRFEAEDVRKQVLRCWKGFQA